MTSGASEAVDLSLTALINPGEHILTPSPDYPLYSAVLCKLGIPVTPYDLNEDDGWQPDLIDIQHKINARTRAIVLINPNNPTGAMCSRRMLEQLAELARRNNLVIFADEIYDKLILDEDEKHQHLSIAAVAPDVPVVTFGGLSKNYLAPGWRIGWGIVSGDATAVKPYIEGIHRLLRARLCANHPEQYAIKPALDGPQDHLVEVRNKLRARRDLTVQWCNSTPRLSCVSPRGAFYAFPRIDIKEGDDVFVKELCRAKHVLVVHGRASVRRRALAISASCFCRMSPRWPGHISQSANSSRSDTNRSWRRELSPPCLSRKRRDEDGAPGRFLHLLHLFFHLLGL